MKFPKHLVEMDRAASQYVTSGNDELPATPLWVARLRNPMTLAYIDATAARYELGSCSLHFWPPVVQHPKGLADALARALFREFDIYPGDWREPEVIAEVIEPPEFLLMVADRREFVLEPHAPRLWRVQFGSDDQPQSVTWWKGFGVEPEFPRDTRRVAAFLQQ
jgi:hypothetical protein